MALMRCDFRRDVRSAERLSPHQSIQATAHSAWSSSHRSPRKSAIHLTSLHRIAALPPIERGADPGDRFQHATGTFPTSWTDLYGARMSARTRSCTGSFGAPKAAEGDLDDCARAAHRLPSTSGTAASKAWSLSPRGMRRGRLPRMLVARRPINSNIHARTIGHADGWLVGHINPIGNSRVQGTIGQVPNSSPVQFPP